MRQKGDFDLKKDEHRDFSADMRKLKTIIKQIPADRRVIAENLAREIEFMAATLKELRQNVQENGAVDLFKQGSQEFMRESPALKAYNTTIQRYSLLYKQIVDMLPKPTPEDVSGKLYDFLKQG